MQAPKHLGRLPVLPGCIGVRLEAEQPGFKPHSDMRCQHYGEQPNTFHYNASLFCEFRASAALLLILHQDSRSLTDSVSKHSPRDRECAKPYDKQRTTIITQETDFALAFVKGFEEKVRREGVREE